MTIKLFGFELTIRRVRKPAPSAFTIRKHTAKVGGEVRSINIIEPRA